MEEDNYTKQTSDPGYLQSDFQQDSDPSERDSKDIKDSVSEQADDSVHIGADTDVLPAQDDNNGEKLKDSPRKDTSTTDDVTVSQDDYSSSRKKSKKRVYILCST